MSPKFYNLACRVKHEPEVAESLGHEVDLLLADLSQEVEKGANGALKAVVFFI